MHTLLPTLPPHAKDPVCGMTVDPTRTPHWAEYRGTRYSFCCPHCREKFLADPERYLAPRATAPPPMAPPAAAYLCPMHPEVVAAAPGPCPLCSMALEPAAAEAPRKDPELAEMQRRF